MPNETYKAKRERVFGQIWPSGEPRNLRNSHATFYLEAAVAIARWVPCAQVNNTDIRKACSTYLQCGLTVTGLPVGRIKRVSTIANSDQCDRVDYHPISYGEIQCFSRELMRDFVQPTNSGKPTLQEGFKYPEAATDSKWGRARYGAFALYNGRIYIAPWLQSNESLIIEWDGYRRVWDDDDPMDTDIWDVEYDAAIKLYVRYCHERDYGVDLQKQRQLKMDWDTALANLMYECRKRTEEPEVEICNDPRLPTSAELTDDAVPTEDPNEIYFANIGDYGNPNNGTAESDVADLVNSKGVDFITSNGDNCYLSSFDQTVGQFYHDWIFPYSGAYGSGAAANKFWPVPSNHDYAVDDGGGYANTLHSYKAFFSGLPGNQRYYDFARGPVHFFMVNSDSHEPDGRTVTSVQAEWLKAKMALSPAHWKIVIFQDPPYRSSQDHNPPLGTEFGDKDLDWPFKDWGADLVIGGDSHYYERLSVNGLTYIVNGAGGQVLGNNFADPPNAYSVFRYPSDNGALFITANCDKISGEFINRGGTVIDTWEIAK